MPHWFFIINPFSGGKKALKYWAKLQTSLIEQQVSFQFAFTEYSGHAITLSQQAATNGSRHFVAVGGDGTVNEVLQGLTECKITLSEFHLAVIPWGTGNDWAALHKIPKDIIGFTHLLQEPAFTPHDIGLAQYGKDFQQQRHFINFIGTGFDSFLLEKMGAASGKRYKYYLSLLNCLHRYRSPMFSITTKTGQATTSYSLMLMSCIGKFGGAGMTFAPDAQYDDGLFDIINIQDMPFLQRLLSLPYLINGKIKQHKKIDCQQTASLEISCDQPFQFQCDGELIDQLPVRVSIKEKAINVLSNS